MPCSNYSLVNHNLPFVDYEVRTDSILILESTVCLRDHTLLSIKQNIELYYLYSQFLYKKMIFNITVWHKNYQVKEITLVLMTLHYTSAALVQPAQLTKLCGGTQLSSKG